MPVINPIPIDIPEYLFLDPDQVVDYLMRSFWDPIDGIAMVSCPLCASAIENSWQARQKHSIYDVRIMMGIRAR